MMMTLDAATDFGQGMAAGDGSNGIPFGDKTDILLGLDGSAARLEAGLTTGFRRWGPQQGNA